MKSPQGKFPGGASSQKVKARAVLSVTKMPVDCLACGQVHLCESGYRKSAASGWKIGAPSVKCG
jgi:hypothetical protein